MSSKDSSNLIPQPHGGALSPGNPGNKGGGRPKEELRNFAASGFEKALKLAHKRLDEAEQAGETMSHLEVTSMLDKLGKFSIGTKAEVEYQFMDGELAKITYEAVLEECGEEAAGRIWDKLTERGKQMGWLK